MNDDRNVRIAAWNRDGARRGYAEGHNALTARALSDADTDCAIAKRNAEAAAEEEAERKKRR